MSQNILIGVDLGGTTTKLGFMNEEGNFIEKWEIPTDTSNGGEAIVPDIAKAIQDKIEELQIEKSTIVGIGMGAPGPVGENGMIYEGVNLGWKNYPLQELLAKETGLSVIVDNDANIAALGEAWKGAGNGASDLVCVTLGTGVGGGVIVNGAIVQGTSGAAGEIGHLTVQIENGISCNCGKTGCLETVTSATGIARMASEALKDYPESSLGVIYRINGAITAKDVFDCVEEDELAKYVVDKVANYLGLSLANVGNILNPEMIVIGGGVSKAGDKLLIPVRHYFEKYAFVRVKESTVLKIATLGNDAGVVGGAYLVKQSIG